MSQGFTNNVKPETLDWYRASELKHGRICMLATLGLITQHYTHLPDPSGVFSQGDNALAALNKVVSERPLAAIQILLAIFALEALGQWRQTTPGQAPGKTGRGRGPCFIGSHRSFDFYLAARPQSMRRGGGLYRKMRGKGAGVYALLG